jgi:two-component system CheB/CheR fusion protein
MYRLEQSSLPDGREVWELATRLALRDAQGAVVGVAGILRDVTDQKHAEERAMEAVRRRDQFLAMLSHELRNPLGALVNATTVLRRGGPGGDSAVRALDVLDRQSDQMARLLDDLLEVSRVTQGKIELRVARVDLGELVCRGAEAWRDQLARSKSELTIVPSETPLPVDLDAARLEQVLANLLGNAVKYAAGGKVSVVVAKEGAEAVIRVRDTGPGIPASMLESVFDLFVQASTSIDRSAGGLGVGLTLVRSIVSLHGGTVSVANLGEGTGCEFVVRLPLASGPEPVAEERAREVPALRSSTPRARVVVVEDNADNREMLSELLAIGGYECHTAESGPEALALISKVEPTIAIVDIGLPGMDGYALARHLRADPRHERLWLIALTGYGQTADRAASRAAGFDEHLVKPLPADTILERLAQGAWAGAKRDDAPTDAHVASLHDGTHRERSDGSIEGTA